MMKPTPLANSELISAEYKKLQTELHKSDANYGVASIHFAPFVSKFINDLNIQTVLDYGAGKGRLALNLKVNHEIDMILYDPAIQAIEHRPEPTEMVCCIDVLEHIEPALLDNVLNDLQQLTNRLGFFTIHTGPAKKTLADGRNAHLIQEPAAWWLPKLMSRFELYQFNKFNDGFLVIVTPLSKP